MTGEALNLEPYVMGEPKDHGVSALTAQESYSKRKTKKSCDWHTRG